MCENTSSNDGVRNIIFQSIWPPSDSKVDRIKDAIVPLLFFVFFGPIGTLRALRSVFLKGLLGLFGGS